MVCSNTLNLALRDRTNQFAVRHLRGMRERLREVTDAIVASELNFKKAREQMERMAQYRIRVTQLCCHTSFSSNGQRY